VGDTNETGQRGERLAANFLESKGFEIVERNFRCGRAEIDLIARRERWLLFVEVKTRSSTAYGNPEEFVDGGKMSRLYFAAEQYIYKTNWQGHVRFDIVSVKLGRETVITHFEDAIS
jgi:putative endonuclease